MTALLLPNVTRRGVAPFAPIVGCANASPPHSPSILVPCNSLTHSQVASVHGHVSVTGTLGGHSVAVDSHTSVLRSLTRTTRLLHLAIPAGLEAGDHRLVLTLGRSGHHDNGMQGGVLFDGSPEPPVVRVVPTVTAVTPPVATPGATVTVTGTGFADDLHGNVVVLPGGRGCKVTRTDRHYLHCVVGAPGSAPLPTASAAANADDAVSGFQLAVVPASAPAHGGIAAIAGCSVTGGGPAAFEAARGCIAAARPEAREMVTVTNEMLWPVLHPLRATDGAFRQEAFVAHGAAILRLPAAMTDPGGAFTLRLDCGRLDPRNLCMARVTAWSTDDAAGGGSSAADGAGLVGVLCRDRPELGLPDAARGQPYRVELVVSHIEHGEQIELAIRGPGHAYVPVPSEWFWHHADPGGPSLTYDADAHVRVTVNDVASVCRTAGGHDRHHVRCGLEVSAAPQSTVPAVGAGMEGRRRRNVAHPAKPQALQPGVLDHNAAPRQARQAVEIGEDDLLWSDLAAARQGDSPLIVPAGQTWWLDADMDATGGVIVCGNFDLFFFRSCFRCLPTVLPVQCRIACGVMGAAHSAPLPVGC